MLRSGGGGRRFFNTGARSRKVTGRLEVQFREPGADTHMRLWDTGKVPGAVQVAVVAIRGCNTPPVSWHHPRLASMA
jgi:hypothetical protein